MAGEKLYRAMKQAADGLPAVGRSGRMLGVRIGGETADIPVDAEGAVRPGTGGMSVTVQDHRKLPRWRLPRSLGGEGRDPVFELESPALPTELSLRVEAGAHGLVEPAAPCAVGDYEASLASTRSAWKRMA